MNSLIIVKILGLNSLGVMRWDIWGQFGHSGAECGVLGDSQVELSGSRCSHLESTERRCCWASP